ncbi:MAG: type pilus assembly PilZ [Caulobacter sp.]|nr:type pilus assembly PilZ [Caulobacter sp.]
MSHYGSANDNGPPPPRERRADVRRRVLLTGKVVYPHNTFSADCTIRDLSAGGARILVAPEAVSADPFLIVVKDAVVHQATTAWHDGNQAGLKFQATVNLAGETPLHLRNIQRIWVELMPR